MEETKLQTKVATTLNQLPKFEIASDERVQHKFVELFSVVHGKKDASAYYAVEKFHFNKQLQEKPELQKCTGLSLYGAFVDLAVQGLSLDPTKKLAYLLKRSMNAGTRDNPKWEDRAFLQISHLGELFLRQSCGQIKYADNPVRVYEGDKFQKITTASGTVVHHETNYSRKPEDKMIACFIRIVKMDGSIDFSVLDYFEMQRLSGYSERQNRGKTNALYTSAPGNRPDPGFWEAKTIKHAFDSYPKVKRRGDHTTFETEEIDKPIDYGLDQFENAPAQEQEIILAAEVVDTDTGEVTSKEPPVEAPKEKTLDENIGEALNAITGFTTKTQVNNYCKNLPDDIKKNAAFRKAVTTFLENIDKPKPEPAKEDKEPVHAELSDF